MFKKIRNLLTLTAVSAACVFATTGCSLFETEVDKATKIIEAYQAGNVDDFLAAAGEDEVMAYMLGSLDSKDAEGMKEVFQLVHDATKDMEFTVEDNDDSKDGYVNVTFEGVDYMMAFNDAMIAATATSGEAFADMPSWMKEALENGGDKTTMEVEMRMDAEGELIADHNDEFFNALTSGFYEYALWTMTSCTMEGYSDACYMVAIGDELIVSLDEYFISDEGVEFTEEELVEWREYLTADYQGLKGISADVQKVDGGLRFFMYINYEVADTQVLENLDIITDGYGDYISLEASIDSFEADGFKCVTTDYGSGVLYNK